MLQKLFKKHMSLLHTAIQALASEVNCFKNEAVFQFCRFNMRVVVLSPINCLVFARVDKVCYCAYLTNVVATRYLIYQSSARCRTIGKVSQPADGNGNSTNSMCKLVITTLKSNNWNWYIC